MIGIKEIFQQQREYEELDNELSQAEQDEQWRWLNKKAEDSRLMFIDSLLHTCTLDQRRIDAIELEVNEMTNERALVVIEMLKNNQQQSVKEFLKRMQRK